MTKSNVMRFASGDARFTVSVIVVSVREGTFASACVYKGAAPIGSNSAAEYSRGFVVGESLSLHEVVEAVTAKLLAMMR